MGKCPLAFLAVSLLTIAPARAADKPAFRAGAFAQDITPTKFPISVNGGLQDRQATKATDRLHARCLVLEGKTKLAVVVCDSCMLPRELVDEAKQPASKATGIPVSHMLISATHTHTAPTSAGVFQSDPDPDYVKFLPGQIARGIEKAHAKLAPARAGWAVEQEPSQLFNRRWLMKPGTLEPDPFGHTTDKVQMNPGYQHRGLAKPAGPIDPDVSVLSVQTADGKPLALLANYSLHYVGGIEPLSADYFGLFADRIRTLLGADRADPPFVGILSNGTSGDVNNVNFAAPSPSRRGAGEQARLV